MKTIVFKHYDDELDLDEQNFIKEYLSWCEEDDIMERNNEDLMRDFVNVYLIGLGDEYYYCDNHDEVETILLEILKKANIKNLKIVEE